MSAAGRGELYGGRNRRSGVGRARHRYHRHCAPALSVRESSRAADGALALLVAAWSAVAQSPLDAQAAYCMPAARAGSCPVGGGLSLERDGYGWITRYDADGKLLAARWVDGLHAPTGMAAVGNLLYVVDRDGVHEIDISTSRILRTLALPGARFPNDIAAAPSGELFVSDFEGNRIYRLDSARDSEIWFEGPALQNPNGLIVDGDALVVATWGRSSRHRASRSPTSAPCCASTLPNGHFSRSVAVRSSFDGVVVVATITLPPIGRAADCYGSRVTAACIRSSPGFINWPTSATTPPAAASPCRI